MGNVVQMPDLGERTWRDFAAMITGAMTGNGYNHDNVQLVLDELKPWFLEAWQHPVVTRDDLDPSIRRLNDWVGGFALRLLMIAAVAKLQLRSVEVRR